MLHISSQPPKKERYMLHYSQLSSLSKGIIDPTVSHPQSALAKDKDF